MAGFETIVTLEDEAATERFGASVAKGLRPGDLVALTGDLGAGKTTLARSILRTLGITERVPSPTFTLVQAYDTRFLRVAHFDLYRIEDPSDLRELGLDDALSDGAALIEWPEKALSERYLDGALSITLTADGGTARTAKVSGPDRWREILEKFS